MINIFIIGREKEVAVLALEQGFNILGVIDTDVNAGWDDIPVVGNDLSWPQISISNPNAYVVFAHDNPLLKSKLIPNVYGWSKLASVVSSFAYLGHNVEISEGCIIQRDVNLTKDISIGKVCKLNHAVSVHHDCIIGNYCTLAPGCRLLGGVIVEDEVFIGSAAVILPKVKIEKGATIGAGAIVTRNVPSGQTWVGQRARAI